MELGEQIATLREEQALTQAELAEAARISPSTLSQIESGRVPSPHVGTVRKIARALGVEPAELRRAKVPVPLDEAPREAGRPDTERSALEVAREAGRKQYEEDRKARNRQSASEGRQQVYFARAHDEALHGDLRHRHPDELADDLLEFGRDVARLEDAVAVRDQRIAQLEEEIAQHKEGDTRMRQENARLRQDLAECRAEAEREREAAR